MENQKRIRRIPIEDICEDLFKHLEKLYSETPKEFIKRVVEFYEHYSGNSQYDYPLKSKIDCFSIDYFEGSYACVWSDSSNRKITKYWNVTYGEKIKKLIRKQSRNKVIKQAIKKDEDKWLAILLSLNKKKEQRYAHLHS